jgi:hypothetical protein
MSRTATTRSFAAKAAAGVLTLSVLGSAACGQPALEPRPTSAAEAVSTPTVVSPPTSADPVVQAQPEVPRLLLPGQPPPPGVQPVIQADPVVPGPVAPAPVPAENAPAADPGPAAIPAAATEPADAPRESQPAVARQTFEQAELDEMLAPVALYPDSLLSQVMMAATYPLEVVQADRWRKSNANLAGDALAKALEEQPWDPSVKSLVNTPDVLAMMSDKLDWTVRLGDAFIGQQQQVMDTVQDLRRRAQEAGTLKNTPEQRVTTLVEAQPLVETQPVIEREIIIERTDPDVVYVPVYDPYVSYGTWRYPYHRPFFWCPPTYPVGWSGVWFGLSYHCGPAWGYAWGRPDWRRRCVDVDVHRHARFNSHIDRNHFQRQFAKRGDALRVADGRTWTHDPSHRRGVWYRDTDVARRFGAATPPQLGGRNSNAYRSRTRGSGSGSGSGDGTDNFMGPRVTTPSNAGRTTTGNRVPNTADFMGPRITTPSNAGRTTNSDGLTTNAAAERQQREFQKRAPVQSPGLKRDDPPRLTSPSPTPVQAPGVKRDDPARLAANSPAPTVRNARVRDNDGGRDNGRSSRGASERIRIVRPEPVRVQQPSLTPDRGSNRGADRGAAFAEAGRDGGPVRVESRRGSISRGPRELPGPSVPSFRAAPAPRASSPAPSLSASPAPSRSFSAPSRSSGSSASSGSFSGPRSSSGSSGSFSAPSRSSSGSSGSFSAPSRSSSGSSGSSSTPSRSSSGSSGGGGGGGSRSSGGGSASRR